MTAANMKTPVNKNLQRSPGSKEKHSLECQPQMNKHWLINGVVTVVTPKGDMESLRQIPSNAQGQATLL